MTNYAWKPDVGFMGRLDPQVVGDRLEVLATKHGSLTAEIVVQEARTKRSPLHQWFEWDESIAAELYRKMQARELLRTIFVSEPEEDRTYRAFVVVSVADNGNAFVPTDVALSDEDMRAQVLERALRELAALERKYADLKELTNVFAVAAQIRASFIKEGVPV